MEQTDYTKNLNKYYKRHAALYDLTRWSFLFGRRKTISQLHRFIDYPTKILEVGCGTGTNLIQITKNFTYANCSGIDVSKSMLLKASRKPIIQRNNVRLHCGDYLNLNDQKKYDILLLSYALTMMSDSKSIVIKKAVSELNPGGILAVVDFHSTEFKWFDQWMQHNHVEINGKLVNELTQELSVEKFELRKAYLGLWKYFIFYGRKV